MSYEESRWLNRRAALAALFLFAGCSSGSGTDSAGPGGGDGYQTPSCTQTCRDYLTGHGLDDTILLLYNQNVTGTPVGEKDLNGACPLGGSVHITGTTAVTDDGTSTVHLTFDLQACENASSLYSLAFDGSVNLDGTFNNGSSGAHKFSALTLTSTALQISGVIKYLDEPTIDATSQVSVTQQQSGDSDTALDGEIDGRQFSSDTAFDDIWGTSGGGGSSAGSGGSSAGSSGSSGTDCVCYCGWPEDLECTDNSDCPPDTSVPGTSVPGVCGCPIGC